MKSLLDIVAMKVDIDIMSCHYKMMPSKTFLAVSCFLG